MRVDVTGHLGIPLPRLGSDRVLEPQCKAPWRFSASDHFALKARRLTHGAVSMYARTAIAAPRRARGMFS